MFRALFFEYEDRVNRYGDAPSKTRVSQVHTLAQVDSLRDGAPLLGGSDPGAAEIGQTAQPVPNESSCGEPGP